MQSCPCYSAPLGCFLIRRSECKAVRATSLRSDVSLSVGLNQIRYSFLTLYSILMLRCPVLFYRHMSIDHKFGHGITRASSLTIFCKRFFIHHKFSIAAYPSRHLCHRSTIHSVYHGRSTSRPHFSAAQQKPKNFHCVRTLGDNED